MASADERIIRGDDDANDHIESDIPRSGVATPQPDPSDKRLPGINHGYFGQVGSCSSSSPSTSTSSSGPKTPILVEGMEPEMLSSFGHREEMVEDYVMLSVASDALKESAAETYSSDRQRVSLPLLSHEQSTEFALVPGLSQLGGLHPCPTPPRSQSPSLQTLNLSDASSEVESIKARKAVPSFPTHRKSISVSETLSSSARRASLKNPLSSIVTVSNVHAAHFSKPSLSCPTTTPSTPTHSRLNSDLHGSSSYDLLKKLTDDVSKKSIPATPTRALSSTTAKSDTSDPAAEKNPRANGSESRPLAISTPSTLSSAPAAKGKLTVQIKEARGLRKSKDPYVVAVFQRNELVSKGPRLEYGDENEDIPHAPHIPMGGVPISRTTSDSGRPMAIPMKSRQSSNTSLSDYRDFKIKGRRSMTNPKWDTEAVL